MTILIIEDEFKAAERLAKLVKKILPEAEIPEPIDSVEAAVNWLEENPEPEVLLMDIELADGKSFDIFAQHRVTGKVIFCTAFDRYAVEAFRHHGIAYLLKPVKLHELEDALHRAIDEKKVVAIDYHKLAEAIANRGSEYQKRLLVKLGQRYKAIDTEDIAYIFTESKNVMVMTKEGREIPVDESLEQLEQLLDPHRFFRINRKIIVAIGAIDNMYAWSRSRLKLELLPKKEMEAVVATDRASNFKNWLQGKSR